MNQDEKSKIEEDKKSKMKGFNGSTNLIMGISAIFISLLSLITVVYQSYLAREENELIRIQQNATVLPFLSYWFSDIDGVFKFSIGNKGVGPAFIKRVEFKATDPLKKESLTFDSSDKLLFFMQQKSKPIDTSNWVKSSFKSNKLLPEKETVEIFSFSFEDEDQETLIKTEFNKYFKGFSIIYEDVYGSAWFLDSEKGYPIKLESD